MKLSLYTFARNAIEQDYHIVAMLKHHVRYVDEIIVNEGYSSDGTYEAIKDIDPKIRIIRSDWGKTWKDATWPCEFKNTARKACTGDWCILVDSDEIIPESQFPLLRERLSTTSEEIFHAKIINFYGNYRVFHGDPQKIRWPEHKMVVHRNDPKFQVWGDGANVGIMGQAVDFDKTSAAITIHHFGAVRDPGKLRLVWSLQGAAKKTPNLLKKLLRMFPRLFDFFPHRWDDPWIVPDLKIYDGDFANAVIQDKAEFTRDNMLLFEMMSKRRAIPSKP